jgi:hypothetical protein
VGESLTRTEFCGNLVENLLKYWRLLSSPNANFTKEALAEKSVWIAVEAFWVKTKIVTYR